jgi:hypothetical protein
MTGRELKKFVCLTFTHVGATTDFTFVLRARGIDAATKVEEFVFPFGWIGNDFGE